MTTASFRLMLVTDPASAAGNVIEAARSAAAAGVDLVQARDPHASDRQLHALARDLVEACRPHGAHVVVNDRLDVAIAAGADGVHLKAGGLPPATVRRALAGQGGGRRPVVGVSTHDANQLAAAALDAAVDYCTIGPWGEAHGRRGLGRDGLGALLEEARRRAGGVLQTPWLVLGGVTAADVAAIASLARPDERWGVAAVRLFQGEARGGAVHPAAVATRRLADELGRRPPVTRTRA